LCHVILESFLIKSFLISNIFQYSIVKKVESDPYELGLIEEFFLGLIKFLIPINIHSFVFSPYKIKSHFLVLVTFSLSILETKTVDEIF